MTDETHRGINIDEESINPVNQETLRRAHDLQDTLSKDQINILAEAVRSFTQNSSTGENGNIADINADKISGILSESLGNFGDRRIVLEKKSDEDIATELSNIFNPRELTLLLSVLEHWRTTNTQTSSKKEVDQAAKVLAEILKSALKKG